MANIDLHGEGIDLLYHLIENYSSFGLNEEELAVILVVDHLLRKGNRMVTSDLLSLKMKLKTSEIDKILTNLVRNEYLAYETTDEGMVTSLKPLKEKLLLIQLNGLRAKEIHCPTV